MDRNPKILVCDDDLMVRVLARECLEEAGMLVVEAADGDEALKSFALEKPDLVFLDVEMPGKTGFEVCEAIRASSYGKNTPILIATGAEDRESIDRGFNAGATQYKTKPVNWSLLSRDIRYMLRAAEAFIELKSQEDRLRRLAYYDHLTSLPNRRSFNEQLRRNMLSSSTIADPIGLILINVDHFKRINDSIGHERGDQLLKGIAARLHDRLAQIAYVASDYMGPPEGYKTEQLVTEMARPGGDEFSVIVRNADNEEALKELVQALIDSLEAPIPLGGHQNLIVTPSIGVAMSPTHGDTPEILLRSADAAMRAAKSDGRARMRVYDESLYDDAAERLLLAADLRNAMKYGDELRMVYQPQIDTATGLVSGVEALIRWNHPDLGSISPAKFIPVAEGSGLISPLGDWILRAVNDDATEAGSRFPKNVAISINLSPLQFTQSDFVAHLKETLSQLDVQFKIELELTEGVIMSDAEDSLGKLRELKSLGFDLAIDDFGTGYSSLSYLRNFPIDTLKIDRSFVNDLGTHNGDGIVKAILSLGQALDLRIVAEGVETIEQAEFLGRFGCTSLQGFLLARPLPVNELLDAVDRDYSEFLSTTSSDSAASASK